MKTMWAPWRIEYILETNAKFVDNKTVDKIIVEDDHSLLTLLDDTKSINLYMLIEKCWSMFLKIDTNQRRKIQMFSATKVPDYKGVSDTNTDWFTHKTDVNKDSNNTFVPLA